jgi:hypothetical protein
VRPMRRGRATHPRTEGSRRHLDERDARELPLCTTALCESFWHDVDGDDLLHERSDGERKAARPGACVRTARCGWLEEAPSLRAALPAALRAGHALRRRGEACLRRLSVLVVGQAPAPPLVEISQRRALRRSAQASVRPRGPAPEAGLVAAQERRGAVAPRLARPPAEARQPREGERVERPAR